MAIRTAALTLLTFPQAWDAAAGRMRVRYLCFPRVDPDVPLAPGGPSFADAALAFEARLVPSLARLPASGDVTAVIGGAAPGSPLDVAPAGVDKAAAFAALGAALDVAPRPPDAAGPPRPLRILKPETGSWRALNGTRRGGRYLVGRHDAWCAMHASMSDQPPAPSRPPEPPRLRWGEAMALALRTEPLARALGLVGETEIPIDPQLLADGGWLAIAHHATSDYAGDAGLVSLQAARIPPLRDSRTLYAATLFPLDQDDYAADEPVAEAIRYGDGFARRVHVAQAFDDDEADDGSGDGDCIQIAWDDEQVTEWLNRQTDPGAGTPMGTIGYRIDVRDLTAGGPWRPMQTVASRGSLGIGPLDIGAWTGERSVEVVPLRRGSETLWLPAFFATWRGSSLVLTDPDLVRLQEAAGPADPQATRHRLDREKTFDPVGADAVPLRYGHRYAFRVRLADLTHGGPGADAATPDDPDGDDGLSAEILFQRRRRPAAVEVRTTPTRDDPRLVVGRPLLRFPELRFAGDALQEAEAGAILAGKPDPDVTTLRITLEVRGAAGDTPEWQPLYTVERDFPEASLTLPIAVVDVPRLDAFGPPAAEAALPIPAEREVRLLLTPLGRADAGYFAGAAAREGLPTTLPLRAAARREERLIVLAEEPVAAHFFRAPSDTSEAPRPLDLLAQSLGLVCDGLTLSAPPRMRTVLACGSALTHTPTPEGHAVQVSADADLRQRWITVLRFTVDRDWSWRGLAARGLRVDRTARPLGQPEDWQPVGTIQIPAAVARQAIPEGAPVADPARAPERQITHVVFLDAVDPLAVADGDFPAELTVAYRLVVPWQDEVPSEPPPDLPALRLPVTTPPRQVPRLVSAGLALSPFDRADDYSRTAERERHLWLEFEEPPRDPGDAYFARVLALAPDPLLTGLDAGVAVVPEPPLPLDDEWMRRIVPGQSADASGRRALPTRLGGTRDGRHLLVPLPEGLDPHAPDLLGMFTYELRLGHADERWCTAHGRWGPPLRIAGVQHPPPPLRCEAARLDDAIAVGAPFASPVHGGRQMQPRWPRTRLWALLYARVVQADGDSFRNLLLMRAEMRPTDAAGLQWTLAEGALHGIGVFDSADLTAALAAHGLPPDQPLTALAAEVFTEPEVTDPLADQLGEARLLRVSTLVPVPDAC
ncbi:MAG: hypothetical protein LDL44_04150 [Caenispirillum sp.]|nr:hypothetical protein [Caenispirillum sp.]